ncbi:Ribosome-recycling factor [Buchnera aphidicola (Tetraneura ulmi)]|uniref:ribosome recycling factor n=1 Tax=Buchnera aphidicola TaxID=9 RepID=UPI003464B272
MLVNFQQNAKVRMDQTVKFLEISISKIRTGRASPKILENIFIKYFGIKTPLKKIANIVLEDFSTLKINVFDSNILNEVQKSIINSNLGLNPIKFANFIRVKFPSLTEERRKNLVKLVRSEIESSKVSIRSIRRDCKDKLKIFLKKNMINKDTERIYNNEIQKITDIYIKKIDSIASLKEIELSKF